MTELYNSDDGNEAFSCRKLEPWLKLPTNPPEQEGANLEDVNLEDDLDTEEGMEPDDPVDVQNALPYDDVDENFERSPAVEETTNLSSIFYKGEKCKFIKLFLPKLYLFLSLYSSFFPKLTYVTIH